MGTTIFTDIKRKIIKPKVKYFRTLDTISVRRFDFAMQGQYFALVESPDNLKNLPEEAAEVWEALYKEFTDRTMESDEIRGYLLEGQLKALVLRFDVVSALLNALIVGRPEEIEKKYIEELKGWGYVLDVRKERQAELKRLQTQLRASLNKINRVTSDLEDIIGERKTEEEHYSLNKLKIKAKLAIDVDVDLDTTTMDEWLIIWDEIDQLSKRTEKQNAKRQFNE